jgi:hypothetical protein
MYEIIDNFLNQEDFLKIKNSILNSEFSWNLTPSVSNLDEKLKVTSSYYFTHIFYSGFYMLKPQNHTVTPKTNFEVVDIYKECKVVKWNNDMQAEFKYFLHCNNTRPVY